MLSDEREYQRNNNDVIDAESGDCGAMKFLRGQAIL
jgi:hypothetical protein